MTNEKQPIVNLLDEFLNEFLSLTKQITEETLKQSNDEDEKGMIKAFSPSLINQVSELSNFVRDSVANSSKQAQANVNQALKVSSGTLLAKNAKSLFPSIGSLIGKLGLDRIIKEIKKIIQIILDALGIKLPKWLHAIVNLIDEIFGTILSGGSSKMLTIMSVQEQNYLAELTQLAKLQQANQFRYVEDEDEE